MSFSPIITLLWWQPQAFACIFGAMWHQHVCDIPGDVRCQHFSRLSAVYAEENFLFWLWRPACYAFTALQFFNNEVLAALMAGIRCISLFPMVRQVVGFTIRQETYQQLSDPDESIHATHLHTYTHTPKQAYFFEQISSHIKASTYFALL